MKTLQTVNFLPYLCKIIIQTISSLTVHDNLWTLKFDNFSEFQNVIRDSHHWYLCGRATIEGKKIKLNAE